jgi:hypothetical protein
LRRSIVLLTTAGAVALLAAGCGGSKKSPTSTTAATTTTASATTAGTSSTAAPSAAGPPLAKAAYDKKMAAIGRGISASLGTVSSATDAKSAATALAKVQEDLRNASKQLEQIAPPKAIAVEHAKLTKAVGDLADDLGPVIDKLRKGNFAALQSVGSLPSFTAIQAYAGAIENAGYKIG